MTSSATEANSRPGQADLEEEMEEANEDHVLPALQSYVRRGIVESGTTWDNIVEKIGTEREAEGAEVAE